MGHPAGGRRLRRRPAVLTSAPGPGRYAPLITAELDQLDAARLFSDAVLAALRSFVNHHRQRHLCAPREDRFAQRLYGEGLPYGPDCPGLAELADDLNLHPGHTEP